MKIDAEKLQGLVDYPVFYRRQLLDQANRLTMDQILKVMDIFIMARETERLTDAPRLALELALVRAIVALSGGATPVVAPAPLPPSPPPVAPSQVRPAPVVPKAPVVPPPQRPSSGSSAAVSSVNTVTGANAGFSLADVKQRWDEMTAAVQAKKTYLGTYLLEGSPVSVDGNKLTVAFPGQFLYHKECLEEPAALMFVNDVFSLVWGQDVAVNFTIMEGVVREEASALKEALDMVQGEVVNEWHNNQ